MRRLRLPLMQLSWQRPWRSEPLLAGLVLGLFSLAVGFSWLLFVQPIVAIALVIITATLFALQRSFEQTVLSLLLLRSALDVLTAQQVPAMFAIALNLLTLGYAGRRLLLRQAVQCDRFWWVLFSWVLLQGIWVVLLLLNGLGGSELANGLGGGGTGGVPDLFAEAMREWVRLFSLAMVYLLVMQLRGKVTPQRLATWLMLSLAVPLVLAGCQWIIPDMLPPILQSGSGFSDLATASGQIGDQIGGQIGSRIDSSLGHYNSFATFSLLFMALALWRSQLSRKPWAWWLLAGSLLLCLLLSKSLTGLVMLAVFASVSILIRLKNLQLKNLQLKNLQLKNLQLKSLATPRASAGVLALSIFIAASLGIGFSQFSGQLSGQFSGHASGQFSGQILNQSRLSELRQTPLMNEDLSLSRAIALQAADEDAYRNSFNWRLLHWQDLLQSWQRYPVMGYGLATTKAISAYNNTAHNDYIRFLVETGVVGLSLFLLFWMAQLAWIVRMLRQSWPGSAQRLLAQTMLAYAVAMLVGMTAGNVMVHTATFFYWWTLVAISGWVWPTKTA